MLFNLDENNNSSNLSDAENSEAMKKFYSELNANSELKNLLNNPNPSQEDFLKAQQILNKQREVNPTPQFVIKTNSLKKVDNYPKGLKIFINVCSSHEIPSPPLVTDDELRKALHAEDNVTYKVPLSLTGPRADLDKGGKACLVFEACVNSIVTKKAFEDEDYKLFIIELCIEWVEEKHKFELNREFSIPKMKSKGKLGVHLVNRPKKPYIAEVEELQKNAFSNVSSKDEKAALAKPQYKIIHKGEKKCSIEVQLPKMVNIKDSILEFESNTILFKQKSFYLLELIDFLEFNIVAVNGTFDLGKRILIIEIN
ncbi:PIH1 domain-containing protein 1 [Clydaea vesicula]|uniref:PIH1 domain-containing protein 1 n=1 Tax=Clydaea vesicula TaxID=447962 RepID=A0AAD5XWG1_9FUNG|nr:PIH1 domain-containing protein 1 [Clydaea vesicula]